MKKGFVVVGLGYGDCGKGATVDALVRRHGVSLVIRFNGGPQAGHNVVCQTVAITLSHNSVLVHLLELLRIFPDSCLSIRAHGGCGYNYDSLCLASRPQHGIREHSHQTYAGTAVYQSDVPLHKFGTQLFGGNAILRSAARTGAAEHADFLHAVILTKFALDAGTIMRFEIAHCVPSQTCTPVKIEQSQKIDNGILTGADLHSAPSYSSKEYPQ